MSPRPYPCRPRSSGIFTSLEIIAIFQSDTNLVSVSLFFSGLHADETVDGSGCFCPRESHYEHHLCHECLPHAHLVLPHGGHPNSAATTWPLCVSGLQFVLICSHLADRTLSGKLLYLANAVYCLSSYYYVH